MKKVLLFCLLIIIAACGGVKKTQEALNTGNYTSAMNRAIKNLTDNKTKKGHQTYVLLLEDAFAKNAQREMEQITFLQSDGNPANLETIYNKYLHLKEIQERIRPLMPLPIYNENRNASFDFVNYDSRIVATKNNLSEYLYSNASNLLTTAKEKADYRAAYGELKYLQEINPGYKNTIAKMDDAYHKGLEYVMVEIGNDTQQIIPERLEEELLDFNAYGINNFWMEYHANPVANVKYDYALNLNFREINVSPEQVNEKEIIKEKMVKDGYEYVLDDNGNVAKDSLGNDIKVDKFKKVRCNFYQFT
ncbi:MAG: hypothetical protein AB3N18_05555, partial [Allomuricauda sp.]